jgi:hypothetical protein
MADNALFRRKAAGSTGQVEEVAATVDTDQQFSQPLPDIETAQRAITGATPTAILKTDGTILFDSTSNIISISLPAASVGKIKIHFKDIGANSSVNNITINRAGSDTIVDSATGQTSTIIASNGFSGYFLSNGVDTWYLL